jgi:NAD(P)-dependent dehydrogenase (short-subunit alcohol dehydrogenase family)
MSQPLRGRVALVTGGSRGIGAAIALALAEAEAAVGINYRSRSAEAEVVADTIRAPAELSLSRRTFPTAAPSPVWFRASLSSSDRSTF